ncbi:MAG: bifunctional precorrin-2 dehydrogenase/sirohydrochlorin ferrochelatase [Candidatus Bathyarchaeota archaeon]|nr:bifunctional precorrin-2 dehydrogenase/sirohydrochlorin ferrochelatase [Candidatus Bathyarchaeota archaeon]
MLVDLKSVGKYVVVVGGGSESLRKTRDFLEAGAKILVVSRAFSSGIKTLQKQGKIKLQQADVKDAKAFFASLNPTPELLVAVTSDHGLNAQLISQAKSAGCMVYAPDNPSTSDFILPAIAKVGDVRIAISTSGKSPAMASIIRKRIEKIITPEDLLQVQLQEYMRGILKGQVSDQKTRRPLLYKILQNETVQRLLKQGKFDEAKEMATEIVTKEIKLMEK